MEKHKRKIKYFYNSATILVLLIIAAFTIFGWRAGIFSSVDALKSFVQKAGVWSGFVFILLQIIQIITPIPGGIILTAGVLIFGAFWGFFYNYIGIVIGSVLAFALSRKIGAALLQSITPKKTYDKYIGKLNKGKSFDRFFIVAILLPGAPDDFLAMLAGLTKMSLKRLTLILLLCKPPSILAYSLGLTTVTAWLDNFMS